MEKNPAVEQRHYMDKAEAVGNYRAQWGEGPIWDKDRLLYVDIEGRSIVSWQPNHEEILYSTEQRVGTVVPREAGGLVFAGDHGFFYLDEVSSEITAIADPEPDLPDNRFNDGKCDPQGRFWAGTISLVKDLGAARLYRLDPDQQISQHFEPVTNSNGLCWSLDGQAMYYIDTPRKEVLRFDFNGERGEISNPQQLIGTTALEGSPDGMTIDANGNLWVAFVRGGMVRCFDSQSSEILAEVPLPCSGPTAVAFGGDNLETLYITTGQFKDQPEEGAGYLYALRPGVAGVPAYSFAG